MNSYLIIEALWTTFVATVLTTVLVMAGAV